MYITKIFKTPTARNRLILYPKTDFAYIDYHCLAQVCAVPDFVRETLWPKSR